MSEMDREWLEAYDELCVENDQLRARVDETKAEAARVRELIMQGTQRRLWPRFSWEPAPPAGDPS